jgi:hypothetical protein
VYLETGVKLTDLKQTVHGLALFKEMKMRPRVELLASIGRIDNLPVEVYAELLDYKEQFGVIRQKTHIEKLEKKELKVIERANIRRNMSM